MSKTKSYIENNKYLRNALILMLVFSIFIAIDLLTKHLVFEPIVVSKPKIPKLIADWKVIGWRSQAHFGTMFLDWFKVSISRTTFLIMGYLIGTVFIFLAIFSKKKIVVFSFSLALSGIIGNTFDYSYLDYEGKSYVRNIMYLPWLDKGTFNFADSWIVIGSGLAVISLMVYTIKEYKDQKHQKINESNLL